MDVFVEILSVQYRCPEYTKVKVVWWNHGQCGMPYCLNIVQKFKIKRENHNDWTRLSQSKHVER